MYYTVYWNYTMSRIIFKLEEIEEIKKRLESIIQRGQKIDSSEFKELIKQNQTALPKFLDKYEAKVFEYIRNNPRIVKPGCCKRSKRN